jgi:tetratricopeptide (TPR) repeat protein
MKNRIRFLSVFALGLASPLWSETAEPAPEVDANAIINESYEFLRNREPQMTAAEFSLYETIVPMVFEQPDYAMRLLETMISDDEPESAAFEFILGNLYFVQERYVSAEARFRNALKRYPEFIRAWLNLGVLLYTQERYSEAVPCFTEVLSLGNRDARTFGLLAYSLQRSGNPLVAEMAYMQALTAKPKDVQLIEGLLKLYLESGELNRAEAMLKQLIRIDPGDGRNYLLYANTLYDDDRPLEAVVMLEVAAGLERLDTDGELFLANLYAEMDFHREAVATYRQVIERDQELGVARSIIYAQALIAGNRLEEAGALLSGLEDVVEEETRIPYLHARAEWLYARKDLAGARGLLQDLVRLDPMNGDALVRLGQVLQLEGDLARAELILERAYQLPETRRRAGLELANIAVRYRRYEQSVGYIQEAIRLESSTELREHLERLKSLVSHRDMERGDADLQ